MAELVQLKDVASIQGGQILKRVVADKEEGDRIFFTKKVITTKSILDDGTISLDDLSEIGFKSLVDRKRISEEGDIVIKLSTPFTSALITWQTVGCVVPSFCAIIKCSSAVNRLYMQSFLSSTVFYEQLQKRVAGAFPTLIPIRILGEVPIPLPSMETQLKIAADYKNMQERIVLMKKIASLEGKKTDIIFRELIKK